MFEMPGARGGEAHNTRRERGSQKGNATQKDVVEVADNASRRAETQIEKLHK